MSDIHHHLGVCPQFDIQYPELTAEEHLLFYARLKGVKLGRAGRVVEKALRQVGITLTMGGLKYYIILSIRDIICNLTMKTFKTLYQLLNYIDLNRKYYFVT